MSPRIIEVWARARDGFPMTRSEEARFGRSRPWGRKYHAFPAGVGVGAPPACGARSVWRDERLGGNGGRCEACERALAACASNDPPSGAGA